MDRTFSADAPDARELFRVLRAHLAKAGTDSLLLCDPEGDVYLAVDTNLDRMASRVLRLANWARNERRAPDVMADTGVIVTDFKPTYPPPDEDSR